jgi:hypothetical protein
VLSAFRQGPVGAFDSRAPPGRYGARVPPQKVRRPPGWHQTTSPRVQKASSDPRHSYCGPMAGAEGFEPSMTDPKFASNLFRIRWERRSWTPIRIQT